LASSQKKSGNTQTISYLDDLETLSRNSPTYLTTTHKKCAEIGKSIKIAHMSSRAHTYWKRERERERDKER